MKRTKKIRGNPYAKLSKMMTRKEINELRASIALKWGNRCSICLKNRSEFKNALSIDHNHTTGKIRGLLCYRCNKFRVGRQTIETCREVLEYLVKFDVPLETK